MLRRRWLQRKAALAAALLGALALSGCSSVVARVNGQDITRREFHEQLERADGLQVLGQVITRRLLLERAEKEGVMPSAADVQAEFDKFKKEQFGGDEQKLRAFMKANAADDKALLDQFRFRLAVFRLRTKGLKPSDEDLRKVFDEHRGQLFDKPDRVTFRQLVTPSLDDAKQAIAELNNTSALFETMVAKYSRADGAKETGGLVEDMPLAQIEKEAKPVHAALLGLKADQITQEPVKIAGREGRPGYVVLKLIKRSAPEPANFADKAVQEQVRNAYLALKARSEQEVMAEAAKGAQVVVLDERFKPAIEATFNPQAAAGNVPEAVSKAAEKGPEIAPPTRVDDSVPPADAAKGAAPKAGPAKADPAKPEATKAEAPAKDR